MTAAIDPYPFLANYQQMADSIADTGWSVSQHCLPAALTEMLIERAMSLPDHSYTPAGIGRGADLSADESVRRDEIRWIGHEHPAEQQWLQWMEGLRQHLNQQLFLGLFSYESHFAHYTPGAFYKQHVDAFRGDANRILSTVFYLNRDWSPGEGGELVLYQPQAPLSEIARVRPEAGTLAVFLSEEFPHEVLTTQRDRYSIAGWFRINGSHQGRIDPPR